MSQKEVIQQCVDELIKKASLDDLPGELLDEQKKNLLAEVERRLGLAVARHLEGEDLDELSRLLETEDIETETLLEFFRSKVANFDELVKETLTKFATEFLQSFPAEIKV